MQKLRFIAATLAAALCALALSVGAALAEDMTAGAPKHGWTAAEQAGNHWAASGLCLLDGKTVRVKH